MALQKCKECGNQVSTKAKSCPSCGAEQPKKTSLLTWIFAVVLAVPALVWMFSDKPEAGATKPSPELKALQAKAATKSAISGALKDPDSAKFEFLNENCGTVNSKNSFGGYVGPKRFVSINDMVELEGHSVSKSEMDALWKKHCS